MNRADLSTWLAAPFNSAHGGSKPIIGMVHLDALPGSPNYGSSLDDVRGAATADARALAKGGVDAVMIENFGDAPFYPGRVPAETIACMTEIAGAVRREIDRPLGVNVLRNDGCAALAIAHAVGARFIRVNVLCGAVVADQGVIEGIAHDLLRLRRALGAQHIAIFADVNVKHAAPLAAVPIEQQARDMIERGGADALIVTGAGTGMQASREEVIAIRQAVPEAPLLVGSGVTQKTIGEWASIADGFIVGSSLKREGRVDVNRVKAMVKALRTCG